VKFNEEHGRAYLAKLRSLGIETRSIVVMQKGSLAFSHTAKPFSLEFVHPLYSVTKSFTSVAVGMLKKEGKLGLDEPWIAWFPEYKGAVVDHLFLEVSIRHLLTMTLGQDREPYVHNDDDWAMGVIGKEFAHKPGTVFFYNSMCSHLLSMLVQRVSGQKLSAFLSQRLFEPLGIKRWWWEEDRHGHNVGGYGLHLSTIDLARFGQCLLDGGYWKGKEVIPTAWVEDATRLQMQTQPFYPAESTEDRNGYGYQFWMCAGGGFRCSGLFGQLCYVRPKDSLVVSCSSSTSGSKALMDPLYEVLDDGRGMNGMLPTIDLTSLPLVDGAAHAGVSERRLVGRHHCLRNFGNFETVELKFFNTESPCACLTLTRDKQAFKVKAGYGRWLGNTTGSAFVGELFPFATHSAEEGIRPSWAAAETFACYGWTSPTTLEFSLRELDSTRRTFIRISVDGTYAVCELWAEGVFGGLSPTKYMMAAKL
jgi:CubicO group peptidase (beta-lactamase class C family)